MKYFYFIFLVLLVITFFSLASLNPEVIHLDLFFVKIEGISLGFSMIFSVLIGALISFVLQLPSLLRRNSKVSDKKDENS